MLITLIMIALLAAASLLLIICIGKSDKYAAYVNAVNKEDFSGSKYYGIGFAMIELFKTDLRSESARKIREQAGILYGRRYSDYYLRVLYAQMYTYTAVFAYTGLFLSCLMGSTDGIMFTVLTLVASYAIYKYYQGSYSRKIEKLNIAYMRDFPNAVSTIALLVNAGMFLRDAWKQVAYSSDEPLYMQMRIVVDDMNNGISEADAIFAFANRCATKEIRKFAALVTQGIEKGGRDLTESLSKQAELLINEKRQLVLQQGEKASNKLMIPIMMIFLGVLVMVMVPIMSNMGV